ncbi:hypothetical protein SASPL_143217 [Salvia splendens]|uniref:UDP-N-acetylmuramoyl-L-alanyl-D-glutamate--2, 6-diaminopimelate ligase n=1 Tax=Salvia splendens TaxID=180675 RepID=A0A8X8WLS1_SALSN|nr:hypothetical protein SASPL_143217 [Salvia splendens]
MPLSFLSIPPFPPPPLLSYSTKLRPTAFSLLLKPPLLSASALGPDGKFYPTPSDEDPPEAPEDSMHGVNKFQQIQRQAARARKLQEEQYKKDQPTFLKALEETDDIPDSVIDADTGDDPFGEVDKAIALKRREFIKQGLIKPSSKKKPEPEAEIEAADELEPEEVVDLEEIEELHGLTEISGDESDEGSVDKSDLEVSEAELSSSFDFDFDEFGKTKPRIVDPKFNMSLAELLDESKVVPISVYGNLEVEITGISHDSRVVESGDLFVCCVGTKTDGHLYLSEADKRGAVAVVAKDTNVVLAALAASFFRHPSRSMSVIGVTGTNGKTTTSHLIKSMYEAMGLRTGMLSTVGYYIHGDTKLESSKTTPDAVLVQKLVAKMVHNGTEALVMEASSHGLALGRCDEIDFDIAVFTNLTRDHLDFHGTEEEYREAKVKLFQRMVDPSRHRKIVNIDDPNARFFFAQGFSEYTSRYNIYNILAAVAVGIAVGAPLVDIVRGIEEVDAVPGRCELIDEEQAFGVIVDYAHTPDALSRLLDYVRELNPRRIITVCGCAGESDRGKRPMMTKIATEKSDITILTSDNPKNEDPCVGEPRTYTRSKKRKESSTSSSSCLRVSKKKEPIIPRKGKGKRKRLALVDEESEEEEFEDSVSGDQEDEDEMDADDSDDDELEDYVELDD